MWALVVSCCVSRLAVICYSNFNRLGSNDDWFGSHEIGYCYIGKFRAVVIMLASIFHKIVGRSFQELCFVLVVVNKSYRQLQAFSFGVSHMSCLSLLC